MPIQIKETGMKRLAIVMVFSLLNTANAALITRTYNYTAGNTITANENNTNENTLYTEFNGNIESANIKNGTITNADIADTQIEAAKFSSTVQSTFTSIATQWAYRRPELYYMGISSVAVVNNTPVANQSCVYFADGNRRCVTEDVTVTNVNRALLTSVSASFSGTKDSGMAPGETVAADTWYAVYAVKTTDVSTDFVLAATTNTPVQANYSRLDAIFGVNSWAYLGLIRRGNGGGTTTSILGFAQAGACTTFDTLKTSGLSTIDTVGQLLATGSAATWAYSSGTAGTAVPPNLKQGQIAYTNNQTSNNMFEANGTTKLFNAASSAGTFVIVRGLFSLRAGFAGDAASTSSIFLVGFCDPVLGPGLNNQL